MNRSSVGERSHRKAIMGWGIFTLLAILILAGFVIWGIATAAGVAPMGYYGYRGFFPFGFFFFPFGLLFFGFFLFFIFRVIFWGGGWRYRHGYWDHWGDASEILKQRYARGEITKEQFEQMMRDLEAHK